MGTTQTYNRYNYALMPDAPSMLRAARRERLPTCRPLTPAMSMTSERFHMLSLCDNDEKLACCEHDSSSLDPEMRLWAYIRQGVPSLHPLISPLAHPSVATSHHSGLLRLMLSAVYAWHLHGLRLHVSRPVPLRVVALTHPAPPCYAVRQVLRGRSPNSV